MFIEKASFKKAFTLTELLVSMVVLGLIATLTLPHMFISVDRAKKRAVFKEAFQALQEATHATMLNGGGRNDVIELLNPKKICPNNALTEGCTTLAHHETSEPGVVLSTGVGIVGINGDSTGTGDGMIIALEEFPKKEYFYVFNNFATYNLPLNWVSSQPQLFLPSLGWRPLTSTVFARPGELKCVEQACEDMFKND